MERFDPLTFIMDVEEASGVMDATEYVDGMSRLIKGGFINHLQGSWQRAAYSLVETGVIDADGNVDYERLEEVMA